ncbi:type III secretion protein X [Desulfomicrobium apsheronum]|jgi:type III secretion protein X|uniref:Type III secretion protein X n=1 Tax=Desulfomicrobium apsheronum TaxID=52560 RepID=A0A1I3PPT2_9BACT|nr:type III secretion protein [Desulfomicrobium apsheronum]MDY0226422.1 type III secretion protein [Desulfomicrobium apsheronum]NCC04255.1 type III secretion protein [Pseudomonadota bacterium]SFJ23340.1 type III secretion protein X [Desulfomicrobium apsheronum]
MVSSINNLLDPSLGIQDIMDPGLSADGQLPQARPLAASVLREAGLEELYSPLNAARLVEQALCPDVGDGELLRPEVFAANLSESFEALKDSQNPEVRDFLNTDLRLLLENRDLLQAYTGLMIGG